MAQIISNIDNIFLPNGREWYHERSVSSDTLLITVGDSWTWGDSLGKTSLEFDDRAYRIEHIYGTKLSKMLDCDFINIAIPGGNNLYILDYLMRTLKNLNKNYNKRYIIFTLTESGRELANSLIDQKEMYYSLCGPNWPAFNLLINGQTSQSEIDLMMSDIRGLHFEHVVGLHLTLLDSIDLDDFLCKYEKYTIQSIKRAVGPDLYLARNFTSTFPSNNIDIESRWVDIIASRGNLEPYPENLHVMSCIGLDPLIKFCDRLYKNFDRARWLELLDISSKGIDWLERSPYNNNKGTKHPLEKAHLWWAEHLYENIFNKRS